MPSDPQTTPADTCPAYQGRGYTGEPRIVYPAAQIGDAPMDPHQRFAVETCPRCKGERPAMSDPQTTIHGGAGWRPIETAPRDGTRVLVHQGGWVGEASFQDDLNEWWRPWGLIAAAELSGVEPLNPTDWMPLPEPPHAR